MSRRPWGCSVLPPELVGSYDPYTREYRVTFRVAEIVTAFVRLGLPVTDARGRAEAMAYYTNDRLDAIATAQHMANTYTLKSLCGIEESENV